MVIRPAGMPVESNTFELICDTHSVRLLDGIIEDSFQ